MYSISHDLIKATFSSRQLEEEHNNLDILPRDINLHIRSFLDPPDLRNLSLTDTKNSTLTKEYLKKYPYKKDKKILKAYVSHILFVVFNKELKTSLKNFAFKWQNISDDKRKQKIENMSKKKFEDIIELLFNDSTHSIQPDFLISFQYHLNDDQPSVKLSIKKSLLHFASDNSYLLVSDHLWQEYNIENKKAKRQFCNDDIVRLLIRNKADPNIRDELGRTPLHVVGPSSQATIQMLLEANADVNAVVEREEDNRIESSTYDGMTPLHIAVFNMQFSDQNTDQSGLSMIQLFKEHNADVNALVNAPDTPFNNMTPLQLAEELIQDAHAKEDVKSLISTHQD